MHPILCTFGEAPVDKIETPDWTVGPVFSNFTSNEVYTNDAG